MADSQPPPGLSFPTNPREFDLDDRISFSKLDNKHIAVQDDGSEFEWDAQLRRWIPVIDEELLAQQQSAYGIGTDPDDVGGHLPNKKRKKGQGGGSGAGYPGGNSGREQAPPQRPQKRQKAPAAPRQNTAIYVTGLPLDVTVDEVHEVFSRKCGVIAEEIDSGRPRIKLYTDDKGSFKGDALVVFFKPQSVEMAIMLLDDTDFRFSPSGLASGRMRVQAADASYKKTNYEREGANHHDEEGGGGGGSNENGNGHNPITKPRDRAREQDKQKIIKRTQKLDAKLADWDDDDPYGAAGEAAAAAAAGGAQRGQDRVVILRHMFTLQELEEDPAAMLEIKEDIRDECAKLGAVTNVVLFDLEPEGVASVRFREPAAAAACVARMDGRAFDGRTVRAAVATGRERFRKSGPGGAGKPQLGEEDDDDDEDSGGDGRDAKPRGDSEG
ncbi:hypothetical protein GGS23DRAFT_603081 [Durotheca rogersii]|uniref:uncharacterized protein n=1 Tax=Durotheca rogersii TaxID=419775 RepID=UPI0022206792|nr:uncharacterized protein GGS23DRAFT_603081 [Durotheca rogersii]KAI5866869.1 hypothetical protein GGS23DRAFT_603081 [Durotheca rogersii]